jgi:hypothetical protein
MMQTSNAAFHPMEADHSLYLGPGRVVAVTPAKLKIAVTEHCEWAQLALGYPYRARIGDTVLAIAQNGSWYVIGVLSGNGDTVFSVPGDLKLNAPRGRIDLVAAKGMRLRSPRLVIHTDAMSVIAKSIQETFEYAARTIKDAFDLRAGWIRTTVDRDFRVRADRIVQRAQNEVKLDGRKIHLG